MTIRSVIAIDDEGPALRRLCKMVGDHPELQLAASAKNSVVAIREIEKHNPDLLLLDIQLKEATAFDILSSVKKTYTGRIIFITAYDQYAVKAFEYEALDYLLKPYTKERFESAIARTTAKTESVDIHTVIRLLTSQKNVGPPMLMIPEGTKNYFIGKNELQYIYSEGYYANFILQKDKKLIRISLKKLEGLLPSSFIRINKSTIINQLHIRELANNRSSIKIMMSDGSDFRVSDTYLNSLQTFLKRNSDGGE
ncbi:response regulator transcription factor [Pricia sp. S334]|uniref:Response regulator transcription factor n=1 Tax=Pricia mediterranea TaxID=3076079 RepID=A0ABU3L1N1_9FLAO|nr:response regulator transcription factor [Pricia sp. S334]MDT7827109.1 response regulator transcription factor [Pricia sp. S334]